MLGGGYLEHLEYDFTRYKVDESDSIMLQQYLANMIVKTGKYVGDKLFHSISHYNNPTTIHFMSFTHHKVEATQVFNGISCILSEELLVNHNYFVIRSGIKQDTMVIWDRDKRTFVNPN